MTEERIIGRIYKLVSPHTEKVYIGSTVQLLHERLSDHKSSYIRFLNKKAKHYMSSFDIVKYPDTTISLIHEGSFDSIAELRRLEGEIVRSIDNACNKEIAGRTDLEYKREHRERQNETNRNFYHRHKDELNAERKIKVTCECGCVVSKSNLADHRKTTKHKDMLCLVETA